MPETVLLLAAGTLLLSIALLIAVLTVASRLGRRLGAPQKAQSSPNEAERRAYANVAAVSAERSKLLRSHKLLDEEKRALSAEVLAEKQKSASAVAAVKSASEAEDAARLELMALNEKNVALTAELSRLRADLKSALLAAGPAPSPQPPAAKPERARKPSKIVIEPTQHQTPAVVTRTTTVKTSGVGEFDEYDKAWSAEEDHNLLSTYCAERSISISAVRLKVDQRQVAIRLVTLLMDPAGEIDDGSAASFGKAYGAQDTKEIVESWRSGRRLPAIARNFNRSQLGIGWKLLDHPEHPVELTPAMIPAIVKVTW